MSGFVVTSLRHAAYDARALYEDCARGEAESRIGEQFELWAIAPPGPRWRPISCGLWFSAIAIEVPAVSPSGVNRPFGCRVHGLPEDGTPGPEASRSA